VDARDALADVLGIAFAQAIILVGYAIARRRRREANPWRAPAIGPPAAARRPKRR
jgi:hypothetical protein